MALSATEYSKERDILLHQLRLEGISDKTVLDAVGHIPRELFMAPDFKSSAYINAPFPIGSHQTISQPFIVARMTEALELDKHHRVLEIGTGSGYQAAILSLLCKDVYSVERHKSLLNKAKAHFSTLSLHNIHILLGDGSKGWEAQSPFDRIIVTAAAHTIPDALIKQLGENGIMIIPVDNTRHGGQDLLKVVKKKNRIQKEMLGSVIFVPLVEE